MCDKHALGSSSQPVRARVPEPREALARPACALLDRDDMYTILIIVLIVLLLGGGGLYFRR